MKPEYIFVACRGREAWLVRGGGKQGFFSSVRRSPNHIPHCSHFCFQNIPLRKPEAAHTHTQISSSEHTIGCRTRRSLLSRQALPPPLQVSVVFLHRVRLCGCWRPAHLYPPPAAIPALGSPSHASSEGPPPRLCAKIASGILLHTRARARLLAVVCVHRVLFEAVRGVHAVVFFYVSVNVMSLSASCDVLMNFRIPPI